MHFYRVFPLVAVAAAMTACSGADKPTLVTPDPAAGIRWVNAVPDTMPLDFRFVDQATNASQNNLAYKGVSGNWRRVPPGSRHMTSFLTGEITVGGLPAGAPSIVSTVVTDGTASMVDGHKYTVIDAGFTKAGVTPRSRFITIEDVLPSPTSGNVMIRFINTDPNTNVDFYAVSSATAPTGAATGTPVATNVAFGVPTAWIALPVTTAPNVYYIRVTATGTTTVLATAGAPPGIPGQAQTATTAAIDPVAGSQISASAFTSLYFPAGTSYTITNPAVAPGTSGTANQATFTGNTAAGLNFLADVNPARLSP